MLLKVPALLTDAEVSAFRALAEEGTFYDGGQTLPEARRHIKRNEQLKLTREQGQRMNAMMRQAVERNRTVQNFALPRRLDSPLISRYTPGMEYGSHVDNPILIDRQGQPMRTDLSMTVFLSPEADYDGGALELETPFGLQEVRLGAGDAVLYSTSMRHRVTPVSRGTRLALVTWIQSMVKEADRRQILFDIAEARAGMRDNPGEASPRLYQAYLNLLKYWSEV